MSNRIANTTHLTREQALEMHGWGELPGGWNSSKWGELPPPPKPRELEEWEKINCGCNKCIHGSYADYKKVPPFGQCYKINAYNKNMETLVGIRLGTEKDPNWKPARKEQLQEWATWIVELGGVKTLLEKAAIEDAKAKAKWDNYKFDPLRMERHIQNMWPHEREHFLTGDLYLAYMAFAREQESANKDYVTAVTSIKTMKDYDEAEKAYKTLLAHVNQHGEIHKIPKKTHKKPEEAAPEAPKKLGRRAARKARKESEKSDAATRQYSRAEQRALARGQKVDDNTSVESDAESDDE